MPDTTPTTPSRFADGTTSYEDVQTVVTPEGPDHYAVTVREADGTTHTHAVERVVINTAGVHLSEPIWFVGANVDVGLPAVGHGESVWLWV
ncbi:hypothetical protein C2R22_18925 [Salinigranum rubrum]|uniref:Uncharacterized protein n=1 Tax=Salinigranum rubrum TaxID=755307 RepID=A0A2I8VNE7_9EURY|nr:hypothetical protein [Salinigranum rubrum]AUV83460.1 hypothetical protein C2R22_18925 [Salinigranum rubrum]